MIVVATIVRVLVIFATAFRVTSDFVAAETAVIFVENEELVETEKSEIVQKLLLRQKNVVQLKHVDTYVLLIIPMTKIIQQN